MATEGWSGYEPVIIAGCLQNNDVLVRSGSSGLEGSKFSSEVHGWLFDSIQTYFKKYKKRPNFETLGMMIDEIQRDDKTKIAYLEVVEDLFKRDYSGADYSTDRMSMYVKRQDFLTVIHDSMKVVAEAEDLEQAQQLIFSKYVQSKKSFDRYKISDYFLTWQQRKIERLDWKGRARGIPTGFENLDLATDGIKKGELWTILAKTRIGKSLTLVNIGANFLETNKDHENLLHIITENPLHQIEGRYDSRITQVAYRNVQKWEITREEEDFMDARITELSKGKSRFKMVKCPPQATTTLVIWEILALLELEGFKPDLIIIDSLEHILPVAKVKEHRLRCAYPFWEMKSLLIDKELPGITSSQAKQTANANKLKLQDMFEAYEKVQVLDAVVGLERDEADLQETGFGRLKLLKNRDGSPWGIDELFIDGNKMTITKYKYE